MGGGCHGYTFILDLAWDNRMDSAQLVDGFGRLTSFRPKFNTAPNFKANYINNNYYSNIEQSSPLVSTRAQPGWGPKPGPPGVQKLDPSAVVPNTTHFGPSPIQQATEKFSDPIHPNPLICLSDPFNRKANWTQPLRSRQSYAN